MKAVILGRLNRFDEFTGKYITVTADVRNMKYWLKQVIYAKSGQAAVKKI